MWLVPHSLFAQQTISRVVLSAERLYDIGPRVICKHGLVNKQIICKRFVWFTIYLTKSIAPPCGDFSFILHYNSNSVYENHANCIHVYLTHHISPQKCQVALSLYMIYFGCLLQWCMAFSVRSCTKSCAHTPYWWLLFMGIYDGLTCQLPTTAKWATMRSAQITSLASHYRQRNY